LEKGIERMPNDVLNAIWNRAWNKWGVNFDMCVYEVEKESAAWKKLNP
jgi:hypothetical protein